MQNVFSNYELLSLPFFAHIGIAAIMKAYKDKKIFFNRIMVK